MVVSLLSSLAPDARCVVFGARGGIGKAACALLAGDSRVGLVYAGARQTLPSPTAKILPFQFDLTDERSIAEAATLVAQGGSIDFVFVATGVLHSERLQPEKTWKDFAPDAFAQAFAVNATGPALIAKHFLPLLRRDRKAVFAALSARVGSIEDNRLGGWTAYRASKAALHQIVRTCAIELQRRNPMGICVALHPGTVDTSLSKPFQRGVPAEKLFSPLKSANHLFSVIDRLSPSDSGYPFAWDGKRIPF